LRAWEPGHCRQRRRRGEAASCERAPAGLAGQRACSRHCSPCRTAQPSPRHDVGRRPCETKGQERAQGKMSLQTDRDALGTQNYADPAASPERHPRAGPGTILAFHGGRQQGAMVQEVATPHSPCLDLALTFELCKVTTAAEASEASSPNLNGNIALSESTSTLRAERQGGSRRHDGRCPALPWRLHPPKRYNRPLAPAHVLVLNAD